MQIRTFTKPLLGLVRNGDSKTNKKLTINNSIYQSYQANQTECIWLLIK